MMFQIDAMSRKPVYEQIIEQLERFILGGILAPGDQLPSIRSLSVELTINPNTILKAFGELDGRGLIRSVPGKGYFVCENALEILGGLQREKLNALKETLMEMALAGIEKSIVLQCVEDAWQQAEERRNHL